MTSTTVQMSQRVAMGEALVELGNTHPGLVVLDGDVANSTGAATFENAYPDRFVQGGIAEQNLVGMAAGMATVGLAPYVATFACFAVARALDSIRVLVAQPSLNVTILGGYTGLLTGRTGKTHQMFNDIACLRSLPNVTILAPADAHELRAAMIAAAEVPGPCYIQVSRDPSDVVFPRDVDFTIGPAVVLRRGPDATLVSTGVQTTRVLAAAELLATNGIDVTVLHVPTIAPLDAAAIVGFARETGLVDHRRGAGRARRSRRCGRRGPRRALANAAGPARVARLRRERSQRRAAVHVPARA